MANPKDILVITTSPDEGIKIKQYLKPVSAHIVAGTNLFSDFFASFSDVFGGRSQTYQKQLTSLYDEAIERIKFAAHEIGANCIIGLRIDMDEISGKGKSMFMLTAIGTAVLVEKEAPSKKTSTISDEKFENVSVERLDILRKKKAIVNQAANQTLEFKDEAWDFITSNRVHEIFSYLLKKYAEAIQEEKITPNTFNIFHKQFLIFIDALPDAKKLDLLYDNITTEENEDLALKLCSIVKELNLLDLNKCLKLLQSKNFQTQKRGLWLVTYDKPFYNKQDAIDYDIINKLIVSSFGERGTRTMKKQLLSSKEKEVWNCECGKTNNDMDSYCNSCKKDIYGFKATETKPTVISNFILQKIELIQELIT